MPRSYIIIFTAVLASLLEIIDTSIVNVAIPTMMGNLGATLEDISWVVTGYIIANAIVLPLAGWLGMRIGRKKYYTGCILLFTITSVGCGMAPNLEVLVLFRIIQGMAGGALLPTSQALIQEAFPSEKAGMASAIYGMSIMIGPTVGPTLGGYLTDNFGWRSIFNINLPLGLLAALMSYLFIEDMVMPASSGKISSEKTSLGKSEYKDPRKAPIDILGLGLLITGIGCFQYVLERGQHDDWFSSKIIILCTALAVICLVGLVIWELHTEHPILDLRLFKYTAVRYGTLLMMEIGTILYAIIFFIPIFANTVLGLDATQTGMLFIPGALASAAVMPFVGLQLQKRDARILIIVGIVLVEIAVVMMSTFNSMTSTDSMFWPLLIRGAAMAFLFVPINTTVLGQFSGPQLGQVAGMMNLFRQLGGSIGIAALSTFLTKFRAQNYTNLTAHLSLLNPVTLQSYLASQSGMALKGTSIGLGNVSSAALKSLDFRLQKQVFILSYEQCMWVIFFFFGISFLPLFFLKPKKGAKIVTDAH